MHERVASSWGGPLQGIRVLDFTRVLAGPAASLALADLGAEVFKIEPPGTGDETRSFPPFRAGESHYVLSVNRGKKSIVVDLKSAAGFALTKGLAAKCLHLNENYRPGVMDRLGLGYEALAAINPRLMYCAIYCTISGWHGVTSVVVGNCGFGFAPCRPLERERAMLIMARNEAVPLKNDEGRNA